MNRKILAAAIIGAILIAAGAIIFRGRMNADPVEAVHGTRMAEAGTPEYDWNEAAKHIGERAVVTGTIVRVKTVKSGVTFLDFCEGHGACPFSAVIFASDLKRFPGIASYKGPARLTGVIRSYKGQAEMVLDNPEDIQF